MARQKNALTKYEVSALETEEWLELGKWITTVSDNTEDNTEDFSDYAGDGTITVDVVGVSEQYGFEGTYDKQDAAMVFIAKKRHEKGSGRIIKFRITDPDGTTHTGPATLTDIIYRGGEASGYPAFSCTIRYNETPVKEEATPEV